MEYRLHHIGIATDDIHLCFETDDIDAALLKMREEAYIPISEKRKSVIEGRVFISPEQLPD